MVSIEAFSHQSMSSETSIGARTPQTAAEETETRPGNTTGARLRSTSLRLAQTMLVVNVKNYRLRSDYGPWTSWGLTPSLLAYVLLPLRYINHIIPSYMLPATTTPWRGDKYRGDDNNIRKWFCDPFFRTKKCSKENTDRSDILWLLDLLTRSSCHNSASSRWVQYWESWESTEKSQVEGNYMRVPWHIHIIYLSAYHASILRVLSKQNIILSHKRVYHNLEDAGSGNIENLDFPQVNLQATDQSNHVVRALP